MARDNVRSVPTSGNWRGKLKACCCQKRLCSFPAPWFPGPFLPACLQNREGIWVFLQLLVQPHKSSEQSLRWDGKAFCCKQLLWEQQMVARKSLGLLLAPWRVSALSYLKSSALVAAWQGHGAGTAAKRAALVWHGLGLGGLGLGGCLWSLSREVIGVIASQARE